MLNTWGISSLDEWDLLIFLNRHRTSLTTVEQISRLLGYEVPVIITALDKMEKTGLVRRSRSSQGVRFYHFGEVIDSSKQDFFEFLLKLLQEPEVRSLMVRTIVHPYQKKRLQPRWFVPNLNSYLMILRRALAKCQRRKIK